jgi:hypothetical protein
MTRMMVTVLALVLVGCGPAFTATDLTGSDDDAGATDAPATYEAGAVDAGGEIIDAAEAGLVALDAADAAPEAAAPVCLDSYRVLLHEAKVVREIFHAFVHEQKSISVIARELSARKIPTRRGAARWADPRSGRSFATPRTWAGPHTVKARPLARRGSCVRDAVAAKRSRRAGAPRPTSGFGSTCPRSCRPSCSRRRRPSSHATSTWHSATHAASATCCRA